MLSWCGRLLAVPTARERARVETTRAILDEARRQLAEHGATGLSLRSVAREVGMVSSAVYRYVPSRDDLLTALIIEAYDAVGQAAEEADVGTTGQERWVSVWRAVRRWEPSSSTGFVPHPGEDSSQIPQRSINDVGPRRKACRGPTSFGGGGGI